LGVIAKQSFGILSTASASGSRTKYGPCVAVYSVERPLAGRNRQQLAWLHRVDHDAIVDELERHHRAALENAVVAKRRHVIVPVEDDVAGNVVEELRRARADRIPVWLLPAGLVLNLDRFSGIARSGQRFSYDQRDWLTDVPHLAERKHRTGVSCRGCRHD
jgi:hypothetical protein